MLKDYLRRPLSMTLLLVALVGLGIATIFTLPIKMYPNMAKPSFRITYGHSDISLPEEMYKSYGRKLVDQIKVIKGLENYTTTYYHGWNRIELDFEWHVDEELVREKIDNIFSPLESGSQNKFWYNIRNGSSETSGRMIISVSHQTLPKDELEKLLEKGLVNQIERIDNVDNVDFWGWGGKTIVYEIDRNKLLTYKLNIGHLVERLETALSTKLAGKLGSKEMARKEITVMIPAEAKKVEDLLELEILTEQNVAIKLGDLGTISEIERGSNDVYKLDGVPAQYMNIAFKPQGDIKKSADSVIAMLGDFKLKTPGLNFKVIVNPSEFIENAIFNLLVNAIIGGIAATLIIFLFLGSFQNTIIIGLSIPFCIITSFILMKLFDVTINIISLGGMAIGIGMILDSSIVTLENIYRRMSEAGGKKTLNQKVDIIYEATKEVALPIVTSILTSIVVFFPIIYTVSYTQAILGDLAKTVIFTLTVSMLASIVIVPLAGTRFVGTKKSKLMENVQWIDWITTAYTKVLGLVIQTKTRSLIAISFSLLLFASSFLVINRIKKEIIAKPETRLIAVRVNIHDNQDISLTRNVAKRLEDYLSQLPEVLSYATIMFDPDGGWMVGVLSDRKYFQAYKKKMKEDFPPEPGLEIKPRKWDPGRMPLPDVPDLLVELTGLPDNQLTDFSDKIISTSSEYNSHMWRRPWMSKNESISVNYNDWVNFREAAGLRPALEAASERGTFVTEVIDKEGDSRSFNLIYKKEQRALYLEELQELPLLYKNKIVPLKALAEVKMVNESYVPIHMSNNVRQQEVNVYFNTDDNKEKEELKTKLTNYINSLDKPMNLNLRMPDPNKEITASFESFKLSLLTSILLVFLIIALLFNSIKYPLIIIATVPFAITGVLFGLWAVESTLSLNSMLGTILLCGLVVNNAILYIDFYVNSRNSGHNKTHALLEAGKLRFRPILMTTLTTLFGAVPIALALGESGEILQPLGVSVFFGLLFSTFLALFVVPAFLKVLDSDNVELRQH